MSEIEPLPTPSRRLRPLEDFLDAIFAPLRPIAEAASAVSARFGAWYTDNEDAILEALQTLTFVGVAASRPENWQQLQTPELMRLHRIAIADQMCLRMKSQGLGGTFFVGGGVAALKVMVGAGVRAGRRPPVGLGLDAGGA